MSVAVTVPLFPESMSLPEDFPAKTLVSLEKGLESQEAEAVYGERCAGLLATYDQDTCSWKTSKCCSDEDSAPCLEILPKSGMTRSGNLYQQPKLGFHNPGSDCGYLPTLPASEERDSSKARILARLDKGGRVARRICSTSQILRSSDLIVSLNPSFAEWMMGFPIGWTECVL